MIGKIILALFSAARVRRARAEFLLYILTRILSTGNLHKKPLLNSPDFVTIDYCNLLVGVLYCYRQGERDVNQSQCGECDSRSRRVAMADRGANRKSTP